MSFSAIRAALGQGLRVAPLVGLGFIVEHVVDGPGGTSAVGVNIRKLNTTKVNNIDGAFLGVDQFTLPAGTYDAIAKAACQNGDRHRVFLYNVTDALDVLIGQSDFTNFAGAVGGGVASVQGRFTIAGTKVFELRHFITIAQATTGLGQGSTDGTGLETYAQVAITEVD